MYTSTKSAMSTVARIFVLLFCFTLAASILSERSPLVDFIRANRQTRSASPNGSNDTAVAKPNKSIASKVSGGISKVYHGIGKEFSSILSHIKSWMKTLFSPVMKLYHKAIGLMGRGGDDTAVAKSKRKREIIGDMGHRIMDLILFPFREVFNIVNAPFRFARRMFHIVIIPLRLGFRMLTMPFRLILGRLHKRNTSKVSQSGSEGSQNMINSLSSMGLNLSDGSQEALINMLLQGWDLIKTNVLPTLDEYLVEYQNSDMLPDNVKKWMKQLHSTYKMLHLFRMA